MSSSSARNRLARRHSHAGRAIVDGLSKTIGLVEVADSDINWMEPRDMTFEEAVRGVNPPGEGLKISSHHAGGANVGWLDAHVSFLGDRTPPTTLRALLTANGGEPVTIPDAWVLTQRDPPCPVKPLRHSASGFRAITLGGANFLFADGSVHYLTNDISPDVLRALLTATAASR